MIIGLVGSSISSIIWAVMPERFVKHVPFMPYLKEQLENDIADINLNNDENNNGNEDAENDMENENENENDEDNEDEENINNNDNSIINILCVTIKSIIYSYCFDALALGITVLGPYTQGKAFLNIVSFLTNGSTISGTKLVSNNNSISVRVYIAFIGWVSTAVLTFLVWVTSETPKRDENDADREELGPDAIITIFVGVFRILDGILKLTLMVLSIFFFIPVISGFIPKVLRSPVHFEYNIYKNEHNKTFEILA